MANSKQTGNAYERDLAKKLSKWITKENDKLICWRDTHSGSIHTILRNKGGSIKGGGDISCIDPEYQWWFDKVHIDSKSLTNLEFYIYNGNEKSNKLLGEWKKVVSDCQKTENRIPIMFVKNRSKGHEFVVFPNKSLNIISLHRINIVVDNYDFVIVPINEFFENEYTAIF